MARYVCVDTTPLNSGNAQPSTRPVDLDRVLPKTHANLTEILTRLNRIVVKTKQLLAAANCKSDLELLDELPIPKAPSENNPTVETQL